MITTPPASLQPGTPAERAITAPALGTFARTVGRDTLYLLASGALAVVAFGLVGALSVVSIALLIIYVGVFVAIAPLALGRLFVELQRQLLLRRGEDIPRPRYATTLTSDPQTWRGLHHDHQYRLDVTACLSLVFVSVVTLGVTTQLAFWSFWAIITALVDGGRLTEQGIVPAVAGLLGTVGLIALPFAIRALAAVQATAAMKLMGHSPAAALRTRVSSLEEARTAAVKTEHRTFRRLERDLHDGPQQQLIRLGMDLDRAHRALADDSEQASTLITSARVEVQAILNEIRALSRGIAPPILVDRGLTAALGSLANRSPVPAELQVGVTDDDVNDLTATTIYFMVAESLANVVKHSRATRARIDVSRHEDGDHEILLVAVGDNGDGGATETEDGGIAGLRARARTLDGTLQVSSPSGGPTVVSMHIPLPRGRDAR